MYPASNGYQSDNSSNTPVESTTPSKNRREGIRRILEVIKRFWYVVLLIITTVSLLIGWLVITNRNESTWQKANDLFSRADYDGAEKLLRNVSLPSDTNRLRVYSQTMLATQNLDKALKGYQKLYDINKDQSVKLIIGNIYNQNKDYDKAVSIYKEIIATNNSNVQAYINLATVYRLQGKNDEALKVANEAVKNNPKNVTLAEQQVSMLAEDKTSDAYKAAVENLKNLSPDDPLLSSLDEL